MQATPEASQGRRPDASPEQPPDAPGARDGHLRSRTQVELDQCGTPDEDASIEEAGYGYGV